MVQAVLAVTLAALSAAIVAYLTSVLWRAAGWPLAGYLDRRKLARCQTLVTRGDLALRDGQKADALRCFVAALFVGPVQSAELAAAVDKHHVGLLSRFIVAADLGPGDNLGSVSLALADRALRQRKSLQSAYVAAVQTGNRSRRREIEGALRGNGRDLHKAVTDLAVEVLRRQSDPAFH